MDTGGQGVAIIGIRELRDNAAKILREVEKGEPAIVTRHGHPIAAITPLTDEDLKDWVLSHHPEARRRIEEGFREIEAGEYVTGEELRRDLVELQAQIEAER